MDSDYRLDLDELRQNLGRTDVVGFYFPFLRQTLLADLRTSDVDGPMVAVTPMVDSVEERVRSLRRLRPRFPRPNALMLVPWPKLVGALARLGALEMLEDRLVQAGGDVMRERLAAAVAKLEAQERRQIQHAITGEGYETLWERKA